VTDWYIYQQSGEPVGPLPTEAVAQGLMDGKIGRDAFVAAEGDTQWQQITKVAELVTAARRLQQAQAQAPQNRPAPIRTVPPAPPPPAHAAPPAVRVPKLPAMTIAVYPAPPPAETGAAQPPASTRSVPPPPRTTSPPPAGGPGEVPATGQPAAVEPAASTVADPPMPAVQVPPPLAAQPAAGKTLYVLLAVAGFLVLLAFAAVGIGLWLFVR